MCSRRLKLKNGFFIDLASIIDEMHLRNIFLPCNPTEIRIYSPYITRLGLALIGSLEKLDTDCMLIMGRSEEYFLSTLSPEEISRAIGSVFSRHPPALIISRNMWPNPGLINVAKKHNVAILSSADSATYIVSELKPFLDLHLAPRVTQHGGLMNVHGEGILILGDSGIGKSETMVELLKRGHKLISDDLVEIRKLPKNVLLGAAPDNIRNFIEVRGIGIINAQRIFGIGAVKPNENVDLVLKLSSWNSSNQYDRMGADFKYTEILGVEVPYQDIPVRPGRNLAVIIEIAAINNRQRKMGYNSAKELFSNLGIEYDGMDIDHSKKSIWDL